MGSFPLRSLALIPLLLLAGAAAFAAPVQRDIPYVEHGQPSQALDFYAPSAAQKEPAPLVVWIHGGAWKLGSRDWITVKYLVDHGWAIASIGYRFSQDAKFPAQIQDCNAALNFLLENSAKLGFDPRRVVVAGGSAGGHLALLLGLARDQADWNADPKFRPAAILDFFGVSDIATAKKGFTDAAWLKEVDSIYLQLLGALPAEHPDAAAAASPIHYVKAGAPPVLLIHGEKDDKVPLDQSRDLEAALDKAGVRNELFVVPGAGHDGPAFASPQVQKKVLSFLGTIPPSAR